MAKDTPTGSTNDIEALERMVYQGTCTVILALQNTDGSGSITYELQDSFDTVFNRLFPLAEPQSREEGRQNFLFRLRDGRRIMLIPQDVRIIIEDEVYQ